MSNVEEDRSSGNADKTPSSTGKNSLYPETIANSLEPAKKIEVERVIVFSFLSLQLQRIAELQDNLLAISLGKAGNTSLPKSADLINITLQKYAEALRDYETLSLHAQHDIPVGSRLIGKLDFAGRIGPQPQKHGLRGIIIKISIRLQEMLDASPMAGFFNILGRTSDFMSLKMIALHLETIGFPPSKILEFVEKATGDVGFRELDHAGRVERSRKQAFTQRLIMAMFGGATLVGPMLIMTLHPSRNTSLITVSVATCLFALGLAVLATDSAGKDVIGATAAYAAVLVVFVGTSS